jgi:hypothetical protein
MKYHDALISTGKILEGYFDNSKNILHNASKGTLREQIVSKVIRPFLPTCYGLSGGEAFDSKGSVSKQLDLVVYDTIHSYIVPYIDNFIQFTAESIYGNIEIKSNLNQAEFDKAIENIKSLKSLYREKSGQMQIAPDLRIQFNGNEVINESNYKNPFFGIIFAYESVSIDTVLSYLKNLKYAPNLLPNAIVLYDKKTIFLPKVGRNAEFRLLAKFDGYAQIECGEDTLAFFIEIIIFFCYQIRLKNADIEQETFDLFKNILKQHPARSVDFETK